MSAKISGLLIGICLFLFIVNHFVINWEGLALKRAKENLRAIISSQRIDLISWGQGDEFDPAFRKRKLCSGKLVAWSDDRPLEHLSLNDSIGVFENEHGIFLYQTVKEGACEYISGYPLYEYYAISNQYLKNRRAGKVSYSIKDISSDSTYALGDLLRFDIKYEPHPAIDGLIGLTLMLVFCLEYIRFGRRSFKVFLFAAIGMIILRAISLYFDALDILFKISLFNPVNFTASFFNPTLGDLLLNSILLLITSNLLGSYISTFPKKEYWPFFVLPGVGIGLLVFHIPWSILNDSQIILDIGESISFSLLRVVSYLIIGIISLSYLLYLYWLNKYLIKHQIIKRTIFFTLIVGVMVFSFNPLLSIPVFFISFALAILPQFYLRSDIVAFSYQHLLFALLFSVGLGMMLSLFIYKHGERDVLFAKKRFANYLLLKQDVLGEYYLSRALENLNEDPDLLMIAGDMSKNDLVKRILEEFSSPYFNKYNIEIAFQDYQQFKLNNRFTKKNSLTVAQNESDYKNIYFIDERTNFKYISKLYIGDLVALIILQVKKRVPSTVYPALLTDSKYFNLSNEFDYAVFVRDDILLHQSKFGQSEWLGGNELKKKALYDEGLERNGMHYYGMKTEDGRTILIISAKYPVKSQLANFFFFFLLLLSSFVGYILLNSIYKRRKVAFTFTGKVQVYLAIAFTAPLFITGLALLSLLNTSYKEEINRSYIKQALYLSETLSEQLEMEMSEMAQSDVLLKIGNYIRSDISFYNSSGYLISTSQPDIFSLGLQSNLVNPIVFEELIENGNQSIIVNKSIGSLEYKVCYAVVNTVGNEIAGFIAMPFFDSKNHLSRQQIEVFESLLIIFGVIFIIAILLSNVVLNNLLFPLRMVAGKIREITLQGVNKPIEYEASDEIGSLVKDYNQMLVKLEHSKLALAKSQKETAWKEIAKQVAHEIKNPLTPMQLKVQQILRKYDRDAKEYESLSSLLTQIDTLSQIAESFSTFAEMPVPDNQVFAWNELVEEVIQLYHSDKVYIAFKCDQEVPIEADKAIFKRILNNLILNAIQAVEQEPVKIDVALVKKSGEGILSVTDKGRGIPEELKEKIFLRYFSTKSTGSGIGLALAKKGIENAGGNIWFDSKEGQGTTFFIAMPLAKL
ncbi:MAG: HAMP domain-containing histidine kinase [Ekhidna sp.]|nr:HAMP domain-containing histidine kinase [Ekhidna sp.]